MALNRLCMMKMCSHPVGTHAWNAIPAGNEHMLPHDPSTDARTNAWLAELHESTRQSRILRNRDPDTGELLEEED